MAESFAILGLAANTAQFLGLALQLISEGRKVYISVDGVRKDHNEVRIIATEVQRFVNEIEITVGPQRPLESEDEKAIRALAKACKPLAEQLLRILGDLTVSGSSRFYRKVETVRQTVRSAWKSKDIQELRRRLLDLDRQLSDRIFRVLNNKSRSDILQAIKALDERNEQMQVLVTQTLDTLTRDVLLSVESQDTDFARREDVLVSVSTKLMSLMNRCRRIDIEQRQLGSLTYESMKERKEDSIKDAHPFTLNWLFESPSIGFTEWLRSGTGIYWIRGKAGSGKSTLMKYACDHGETLCTLQEWAGTKRLVTASFFFWNSGFPMQKSQRGLLQSLLYQVLSASPAFITPICSKHNPVEPWSIKELFHALLEVAKETELSARYCFFIDGLDEYEGDQEDIIRLMQAFAVSPNIKLCISSRPWNEFVLAFATTTENIVLEQHTKRDMEQYVNKIVAANREFQTLAQRDSRCLNLIPQIVEKAEGVWLWVYLVVRDLVRDVKGKEDYHFLQRRLDSFPPDLNEYFSHMLSQIDKIHREETMKIFLVAVDVVWPLPVAALKFLEMESENPDYALSLDITSMGDAEVNEIHETWATKLNSRCKDLLEVRSSYGYRLTFLDNRVEFLHRTVRDFLRDNYKQRLRDGILENFDPKLSLSKIFVALLKVFPSTPEFAKYSNDRFGLVDEALYYMRELETTSQKSHTEIVDELDSTNTQLAAQAHINDHWTNLRESYTNGYKEWGTCTFLALAIQAGLRLYVSEKLEADPSLLREKRGRPLLDYALKPKHPGMVEYRPLDIKMVDMLLAHGADPNQNILIYDGVLIFYGGTVWESFLTAWKRDQYASSHVKDAWYLVAKSLISHGADPHVPFFEGNSEGGDGVPIILERIFGHQRAMRLWDQMVLMSHRKEKSHSLFWRLLGWN